MVSQVEIGGKSRPVKFDFNSYVFFERETGEDIFSVIGSNLKLSQMRALIFAGLKAGAIAEKVEFKEDIDTVGSWIEGTTLQEFTQLFVDSLPKPEGEKQGE